MAQESLEQFRAWIAEQGLDAFYVSQPQNCSYLTGWLNDDEEACSALVSAKQQILLTNALYKEVATNEASGWEVVTPEARKYEAIRADGA
jgi:Xaa-Pro aminopeptidase